jgi:hypothetical protein
MSEMSSAIAYCRVSTQRQGRSGLGIEAQRAAVTRFAEAAGIVLLQEFTEIETETGKGSRHARSPAPAIQVRDLPTQREISPGHTDALYFISGRSDYDAT